MATADEIYALATWHSPALSNPRDALRPRPPSTGRTALLKSRRIRH